MSKTSNKSSADSKNDAKAEDIVNGENQIATNESQSSDSAAVSERVVEPKTTVQKKFRIESDLLGELQIPSHAYYGVHTLRAVDNFQISRTTINHVPDFIRGMVQVKKAAALANRRLHTLPAQKAEAIVWACDQILIEGRCMDQFPIDVFQGGAGTSLNMNTNEVVANLALEFLGHEKGE